jgi:hypothetical protein
LSLSLQVSAVAGEVHFDLRDALLSAVSGGEKLGFGDWQVDLSEVFTELETSGRRSVASPT